MNGIQLPQHYVEQEFVYGPQRTAKDTWQSWHEVTFNDLQVHEKFELNPFDTMIRVGTELNGFVIGLPFFGKSQGDLEKEKADYFMSRKPWTEAEIFHSVAAPKIDPAYTAPLAGQEIQGLAAKYKIPLQ